MYPASILVPNKNSCTRALTKKTFTHIQCVKKAWYMRQRISSTIPNKKFPCALQQESVIKCSYLYQITHTTQKSNGLPLAERKDKKVFFCNFLICLLSLSIKYGAVNHLNTVNGLTCTHISQHKASYQVCTPVWSFLLEKNKDKIKS